MLLALVLPAFQLLAETPEIPKTSPELFEKKEPYENLTIRNTNGFVADLSGSMGASVDFKNPSAFSYTGQLGLGYRFALSSWNMWDIGLELSSGLGGSSPRDITYLFGVAFRGGYGIAVNRGMNFFTHFGFGGNFAQGAKEKARILPGGHLGFQMEFVLSDLFRVVAGPRFSLKAAYESATSKKVVTYFIPEANVGLRLVI